jgi:hypothetical protein
MSSQRGLDVVTVADKENICVCVSDQGNHFSKEAPKVTGHHIARGVEIPAYIPKHGS